MSKQTLIPADTGGDTALESFYERGNEVLVRELENLLSGVAGVQTRPIIYLWGESGSGKTHLLNACCVSAKKRSKPGIYVSLTGQDESELDRLIPVAVNTTLCIDDIGAITGLNDMQVKVLSLYESVIQNSGTLIVSGSAPPGKINLELKDLESRLASGGVYHLRPLDETGKQQALRHQALTRGFDLDEKVTAFIMSRCRRDTGSLFALLDKIDSASLRDQRKITVPFLKTLL